MMMLIFRAFLNLRIISFLWTGIEARVFQWTTTSDADVWDCETGRYVFYNPINNDKPIYHLTLCVISLS